MESKKHVAIDITKHNKTFINFGGNEISREEALGGRGGRINISEPKVDRSETENPEGAGGAEEKEEAK